MKLDKAIELSKEAVFSLHHHKFFDHADAVKMGTEALKLHKQLRESGQYPGYPSLPGEDPE